MYVSCLQDFNLYEGLHCNMKARAHSGKQHLPVSANMVTSPLLPKYYTRHMQLDICQRMDSIHWIQPCYLSSDRLPLTR